MKLAIATPVVTNVATAPLTWEKDASIEAIGRVAEAADRLGYHHLTCSEHIGIPATEAGRRGARYWILSPRWVMCQPAHNISDRRA